MQKKYARWSMKMRYKQKKEQDDTLPARKPIKATRHEYEPKKATLKNKTGVRRRPTTRGKHEKTKDNDNQQAGRHTP